MAIGIIIPELLSKYRKNSALGLTIIIGVIFSIILYLISYKLYEILIRYINKMMVPTSYDRETKEIVLYIHYAVCGDMLARKWRDLARWEELARWLSNRLDAYSEEKHLLEHMKIIVAATKALASSLDVRAEKSELLEWAYRTEPVRSELKQICADTIDSLKIPQARRPKGGMKYHFEHLRNHYRQLFDYVEQANASDWNANA